MKGFDAIHNKLKTHLLILINQHLYKNSNDITSIRLLKMFVFMLLFGIWSTYIGFRICKMFTLYRVN